MKFSQFVVLGLLLVGCACNIWDNVFSQSLAPSPIILEESLNFDFKFSVKGISLNANIDINSQLQLVTLKIYKDLGIKFQIATIQLNIHTLILTTRIVAEGCSKYKYKSNQSINITSEMKLSKQKIYLMNILFEYKGEKQLKRGEKYSVYQFKPNLFSFEKQSAEKLDQIIQEYKIPQKIQPQDISIPIYLLVDSKGQVHKIYQSDTLTQQVPFQMKSTTYKQMQCDSQIQQLTEKDVKQKLKQLYDNRQKYKNEYLD